MAEVSAARIIQRIRANGANVTAGPDGLHILNKQNLPVGALDFIDQHKAEIVAFLRQEDDVCGEPASPVPFRGVGWLQRDTADSVARLLMANDPGDPDWSWFVSKAMTIMDSAVPGEAAA